MFVEPYARRAPRDEVDSTDVDAALARQERCLSGSANSNSELGLLEHQGDSPGKPEAKRRDEDRCRLYPRAEDRERTGREKRVVDCVLLGFEDDAEDAVEQRRQSEAGDYREKERLPDQSTQNQEIEQTADDSCDDRSDHERGEKGERRAICVLRHDVGRDEHQLTMGEVEGVSRPEHEDESECDESVGAAEEQSRDDRGGE